MPSDAGVDPDAGLVESLRRGDADAAERLLERHADGVYRLAMRITGVSEDAEAAASDALSTAARRVEMFQGRSAFGAWIYRLAATAAYQRLRARRPGSGEVVLEEVLPPLDAEGRHFAPMDDWSPRVDGEARGAELDPVLTEAIDALPADYRTALVLHDVAGMPLRDIAETLGISSAEVKSRVHRSRLSVRRQLSEHLEAR